MCSGSFHDASSSWAPWADVKIQLLFCLLCGSVAQLSSTPKAGVQLPEWWMTLDAFSVCAFRYFLERMTWGCCQSDQPYWQHVDIILKWTELSRQENWHTHTRRHKLKKQFDFRAFSNSAPKLWNAQPQSGKQISWRHSANVWKPARFLNDLAPCIFFFILIIIMTIPPPQRTEHSSWWNCVL